MGDKIFKAEIMNVTLTNVGFVVLLRCDALNKALPIVIGPSEAQAILFELNQVKISRPMTHDLMRNLLKRLKAELLRIEINDLRNDTFYAILTLLTNNGSVDMDSRPSDAIALALRTGADIYVESHVIDKAGIEIVNKDDKHPEDIKTDKGKEGELKRLNNFLELAVAEERYEDAARFRDQIKKLKGENN